MKTFLYRSALTVGLAMAFTKTASACAVCMGANDSPIAPAITASVVMLLGFIALVGGFFFRFLIYLARRDGLPLAPHQELTGEMNPPAPQQS